MNIFYLFIVFGHASRNFIISTRFILYLTFFFITMHSVRKKRKKKRTWYVKLFKQGIWSEIMYYVGDRKHKPCHQEFIASSSIYVKRERKYLCRLTIFLQHAPSMFVSYVQRMNQMSLLCAFDCVILVDLVWFTFKGMHLSVPNFD